MVIDTWVSKTNRFDRCKSRFIVGWSLAWSETTEAIAIALKRGIEKYGVPQHLYTDNGKAYKSKVLKGTDELDGIYASLGINVDHARAYNDSRQST